MPTQRHPLMDSPEYEALSIEEKRMITRRVMQVYASHRFPERGPAVHAEMQKIIRELQSKPTIH